MFLFSVTLLSSVVTVITYAIVNSNEIRGSSLNLYKIYPKIATCISGFFIKLIKPSGLFNVNITIYIIIKIFDTFSALVNSFFKDPPI